MPQPSAGETGRGDLGSRQQSTCRVEATYDVGRLAMTIGHLGALLPFVRSGIASRLRRYRFGPLEWLWRYLTYLERPPVRRSESAAAGAAVAA